MAPTTDFAPSILLGLLLLSVSCSPDASRPRDSGKNQPLPGPSLGVVTESARSIPIVYDVDVVVVGGSSAGVAAAAAAARNGARVFLAAPRPYLGEDLCGTYRLWLEPDEEPRSDMAKALFTEPPSARQMQNAVPFTYQADVPSAARHPDTTPASVLNNGKWHSASSQSVQYDGTWSSPPTWAASSVCGGFGSWPIAQQRGLRGRHRHHRGQPGREGLEPSRDDQERQTRTGLIRGITCRAVRRTGQHRSIRQDSGKEVTGGRTNPPRRDRDREAAGTELFPA